MCDLEVVFRKIRESNCVRLNAKKGGIQWWRLRKLVGNRIGNGVAKRAGTRREGEEQRKMGDDVTKANYVGEFSDMEKFEAAGRLIDSETIQINGNDTTRNSIIANAIICSGNDDSAIDRGNSDGCSTTSNSSNEDTTTKGDMELVSMYLDTVDWGKIGDSVSSMGDVMDDR